MKRWLVAIALLGIGLTAGELKAQVEQGNAITSGLASRLRWVQLEVVGGRLVTSSLHVGTNMNSTTVGEGGRRERLSIDLTNPAPNVSYELTDKTRELRISISQGEQITIFHRLKTDKGSQSLELSQLPQKELTLTVEDLRGKRTISGPTLWHLILAEPEMSRSLLSPTLEILRPNWKISALMEAVEEALVRDARLQRTVDRTQWEQWVKALSSQQYADRQAAERSLTETGREVLPYLRSLERSALDAEQWRRTRNVLAALDGEEGDSVEQIVLALGSDPRAWISLLDRDSQTTREVALEQLRALTGEEISFDPSASPEARAAAIDALRKRFTPVVEEEAQ